MNYWHGFTPGDAEQTEFRHCLEVSIFVVGLDGEQVVNATNPNHPAYFCILLVMPGVSGLVSVPVLVLILVNEDVTQWVACTWELCRSSHQYPTLYPYQIPSLSEWRRKLPLTTTDQVWIRSKIQESCNSSVA